MQIQNSSISTSSLIDRRLVAFLLQEGASKLPFLLAYAKQQRLVLPFLKRLSPGQLESLDCDWKSYLAYKVEKRSTLMQEWEFISALFRGFDLKHSLHKGFRFSSYSKGFFERDLTDLDISLPDTDSFWKAAQLLITSGYEVSGLSSVSSSDHGSFSEVYLQRKISDRILVKIDLMDRFVSSSSNKALKLSVDNWQTPYGPNNLVERAQLDLGVLAVEVKERGHTYLKDCFDLAFITNIISQKPLIYSSLFSVRDSVTSLIELIDRSASAGIKLRLSQDDIAGGLGGDSYSGLELFSHSGYVSGIPVDPNPVDHEPNEVKILSKTMVSPLGEFRITNRP